MVRHQINHIDSGRKGNFASVSPSSSSSSSPSTSTGPHFKKLRHYQQHHQRVLRYKDYSTTDDEEDDDDDDDINININSVNGTETEASDSDGAARHEDTEKKRKKKKNMKKLTKKKEKVRKSMKSKKGKEKKGKENVRVVATSSSSPKSSPFIDELKQFLSRKNKVLKIPTLGHKELDLEQLYHEVTKRGGIQSVCLFCLQIVLLMISPLHKNCSKFNTIYRGR